MKTARSFAAVLSACIAVGSSGTAAAESATPRSGLDAYAAFSPVPGYSGNGALTLGEHSPEEFRVNGTVRNHPAFYSTFNVKLGDGMYLPPEQRVSIW